MMQNTNEVTRLIIASAIEVHRQLGPGLLESAYEECLNFELLLRGLSVVRQQVLPINYKGNMLDAGYRLDLMVNEQVIVELKAIKEIEPIHQAQLLTYLKLSHKTHGLLLNFNVPMMKQGITRLINT
jgi:GxxExxY protein